MNHPITPIKGNQAFCFTCSPQVPCFNACCRDLNQVLTPYDVLCLKNFLELPSNGFLNRFTQESIGPGTGFPVVSLRFADSESLACPFVADAGCSVYPARPASCRTYPLARGVSLDRVTGKRTEHWALIREPHCLGFDNGEPQKITEWVADQKIAEYNRMNDKMLELISLKNHLLPGPLRPKETERIYRALYDLDTFRTDLFSMESEIEIKLEAQTFERARSSDRELLIAGIQWVGAFLTNLSSKRRRNEQ